MAKKEKLSLKDKEFVRQYLLNGGNGTKAILEAGFKTEYPQQMASRLLKKPLVQAEIERHQKELDEKFRVSAVQKKKWLKQIVERCLQEEEVLDELGVPTGEFKFNPGEATRAINELNKMDGDHAAVKADLGLNGELSQTHNVEGLQSFTERVKHLTGDRPETRH